MKNIVKSKTIFVILIFMFAITLFHIKVYAETDSETGTETTQWTDFSNVEIELTKSTYLNYVSYSLNLENVTYITDHSYMVYISNSSTKPTEPTTGIVNGVLNYCIDEYLEKSGDIYLWVEESYIDEKKTLIEAYKIDRPSQNPLGERISGNFVVSGGDSISFYEPTKDQANRNIKVKIGAVTDTDVLKQIQNGSSSALSNLLTYAKSASSVASVTYKGGSRSTPSVISGLNLTEGGYYFVYYEADDENGTYYPVEDVSLYQYNYYDSNDGQLVDYLSDQFKWNLGESDSNPVVDTKKDTTVAEKILPKTGASIFIVATLVIILLIITISFYLKYAKYRGIK